jgi:glycosyltransferase involved in cell wall biosynthesis
MSAPVISIIMPFYNAAPFLAEAVKSILDQTFRNFEFIIINDGSTDESENIIQSFSDKRIKYILNDKNMGLVYSLNKGLETAEGSLIARMDGDDISMPDRLERQFEYLRMHPEADLVATQVQLINEKGQLTGFWKEDRENCSPDLIREFLVVNNCIAHPTILAKAEIIKKLRYREAQGQAEDYDLWLRWVSAGNSIHKVDQVLLKHRILPNSFTRSRQKNVFFKLAATKIRFAVHEIGKMHINLFVMRTFIFAITDTIKGTGKYFKQILDKK